jgi:hypothetical protein
MPLLTDDQLDTLDRLAWPLSPKDRTPFVETMTARLGERPELIGPGYVGRVAGGDRAADLGDQDKAIVRVHLGATQRAILGHNSMHGVTEVLDLREGVNAPR